MKSIAKQAVIGAAVIITLGVFAGIAYAISSYDSYCLELQLVHDDGSVAAAFFSPEDDIRSLLLSLIEAERSSIKFAMYTFTDKSLAQALIDAARRGVSVEGVVDRSYGASRYSKVAHLANASVPIWVYQTAPDERQAGLMHNKFFIFEDTVGHKPLLWTGSYNCTNRASHRNQENVIVLDVPSLISSYTEYFFRLKKKSLQISGVVPALVSRRSPKKRSLPIPAV